MDYASIASALERAGFLARSGFHPRAADGVPPLAGGSAAGTVVLVGNAGPAMWAAFRRRTHRHDCRHPLDEWTREVLTEMARDFAAQAVFPFRGPPHMPFQRWAQRAERVWPSPIGVLMSPRYGLWHAYRGALLLPDRIALPPLGGEKAPCADCTARPCLSTCPAGAFASDAGYDVPACRQHLATPAGEDCMRFGCRARRACPVGRSYIYEPDQAAFHMSAFFESFRGTEDDP